MKEISTNMILLGNSVQDRLAELKRKLKELDKRVVDLESKK